MILQRLNPADHFTLVMDAEIRKSGLAGNYCALVLELDGVPDQVALQQCCLDFARRFPRATARLLPQGRHYAWQGQENGCLPFHVHSGDSDDASTLHQYVSAILQVQAPLNDVAPFELHLIKSDKTSLLVLRWFHPAADAKGAELVLHYLFNGSVQASSLQPAPVEQLQRKWSLLTKALLARRAVRNIRKLDRFSSVVPVQVPGAVAAGLEVELVRYTPAETSQIMKCAREHTGMTGTTLYLIGCMMRAMEAVGASPEGDAYCVPYAVNLRRRKALFPIFGNQVGFLFAQADCETVRNRSILFKHLCGQRKAAIEQQLDLAMLPLMQAGSWLSAEKYGRILRNTPDGRERSSFWFSYTGNMEPEPESISGCRVKGMYQASHMTSPPGLGLLASHFQDQLVLSYNGSRNMIQADWLERLTKAMTAELFNLDANT